MSNPLFNRFGNIGSQNNYRTNSRDNILVQLAQVSRNPSAILDILFRSGKINQQQYNELQQYRNNPEAIGKYLINSGKGGELSQAEQIVNNISR